MSDGRESWLMVPLTDVLDFREGPGIMARDFRESGIPLIRLAGLKRGAHLLSGCDYLDPDMVDAKWSKFRVESGDVLLSTSASLGEVAVVGQDAEGAVPYTGIIRFRPRDNRITAGFIEFALRSPYFKLQIEAMGVGSVMRHFGPMHLRRMTVEIPPIKQQVAISEAMKALDDKIAVNDRIASTSLDLAQALYVRSVSDGRFKRSVSMAECGHWMSGGTPSTSEDSYWGGEIPWISASSLKLAWIDDSDRKVTELGSTNGTRLVPKDTIIFVVRGMSLISEFRVGLTQREVAFGQDCKAIRPAAGIDAAVLFVAIKSHTEEILGLVDHAGHGTGRLATDLLSKVMLSLPEADFSMQASAMLRSLVELGAARQTENRKLAELRDTLLPKLMSGEIRVRDAEKVVEEAVLWREGCRRRGGKTSSWSGSPSLGGSPRTGRTSPKGPESETPGMS